MITRFSEARDLARHRSTLRLCRDESRARRAAGRDGEQLGREGVLRWAAIRAELAARGRTVPPATDRRRRWGIL